MAPTLEKAHVVLMELQNRGVNAVIAGSWARGEATASSDIDFLIVSCPTPLKYKIESLIEDTLGSSRFDVIYRDDARPPVLRALEAYTLSHEKLVTMGDRTDAFTGDQKGH